MWEFEHFYLHFYCCWRLEILQLFLQLSLFFMIGMKIIWVMEFGKKADVTVNLAFADLRVKRNVLIFEER